MTDGNKRYNTAGISAAAALLSVAVAIVVSYTTNNWWLLVPVLLLEMGIYVMIIGMSLLGPSQGMSHARSASNFYLLWGNLLAVIGALLLLNTFFPGNVIILLVVFLVWFAVLALLFSMKRKTP